MEEVPDMDDLLDEMESDLIRKARITQPPPLLPPTSIGMQPRGFHNIQPTKSIIAVPKLLVGEDMNQHMVGHIDIDTSELPNTFHTQPIIGHVAEYKNEKEDVVMEQKEAESAHVPPQVNGNHLTFNRTPETVNDVCRNLEKGQKREQEPEPEDSSEVEEETLVPETQMISFLNATVRDNIANMDIPNETVQLDTEIESMLEYLNGFDLNKETSTLPIANDGRKSGGHDSISDESVVSQFADKLSEEVMKAALEQPRNLHYDPAMREFYETNDSATEVFAMSFESGRVNIEHDNGDYLSEPENVPKRPRMPSVAEEEHVEKSEEAGRLLEKTSEENENEAEVDQLAEKQKHVEVHLEESVNQEVIEPDEKDKVIDAPKESARDNHDEYKQASDEGEVVEIGVFDALPSVEPSQQKDVRIVVAVANSDNDESSVDLEEDDTENRSRFDSSIATVHVLHESDSEDSLTPRRERRLTESELQLGKTSPYWIPDSECPNCMLCNARFTLITRRHHCRACGRVLCGSCCNEKALLEYLQEAGKKPQAVRVCKPCSSMLARIEAHEEGERNRRESITSDVDGNTEELSALPTTSSLPRGVLKTRASTHGNEEEGASTSVQTLSASVAPADTSRRSVMFRDGVRPGAPADEENPGEERSTALKPKKKSRKRHAVVRRIAELRMEDELACALPKEGQTKILIVKPDSDQPRFEDASIVLETLCNFSVVTVVLKKNLNCTVQIFNNPNFGLIWAVSTQGFAQIGLDELLFAWTMNNREKQKVDAEEPELDEHVALSFLPLSVLHRISMIYTHSTEHEFAGVRRVDSRLSRIHSVPVPAHPLPKHIMFFRPTVQVGLGNLRIPSNPFLIACFLHDDELNWATSLPNRLLYKLGQKYNVYPTPFVNDIGRPSLYSTDISGTVLKVFTDFRSWSYRMRHIPGCTVSLTNDKTVIRVPKSAINDLKEVLSFSRSMVAWSCDLNHDDDSVLICEETDTGIYSTQVFAKCHGQRESTSASFVILDGGSKVSSLQVNVVEDGVAIRVQSDRLETILNAINDGHDVVESSKDMEFRVEFVEDGDWISMDNDYFPKSQIDGLYLMNKFQYGLSLERALTQVLQVQGISDYGVRMSHVYNLGDGRLQPEEEPKIYGMVEIAARECVAMLEPHMQFLIRAGIGSLSIRLFVSPYEFEYDVSRWLGLEEENNKYKQSLDQLIPMLYNMVEYVPNGFEVEFVLSIVSTRALPI
ncbi:unnamed protein product [Caenorhabditis sp. 36 PRJEB53466]|nr:unnamed protein product [Caenorhabditis sp. 36 PRJEB53466]